MADIDDAKREEIKAQLKEFDGRLAEAELAAKPFREALAPYITAITDIEEERELYLEQFAVVEDEIAGNCEACGRLLLVGESGQRPFEDDTGIIFCAEHGMTYGDLWENWQATEEAGDLDEDRIADRDAALKLVNEHLAAGGSLDDTVPGVV